MKITTCDRCGSIMGQISNNPFCQCIIPTDKFALEKFVGNCSYDIDLCEDCQASLAEWLYMGKKEEKE